MKKFLVAFGILCFVAGFAIGTSHGKPRVYMTPEAVEHFLISPTTGTALTAGQRYPEIQRKYSTYYYTPNKYTFTDTWSALGNKTAELTYNTMNGDVLVNIK